MKDKINISELLKDCQKGMELDCSVFEDVTLYKIDTDIENEFPIRIKTKNDYFLDLTKYGTYSNVEEAKCVIFPKGKTTWKGFIPPCKFKDGDVVICNYGDIHLLRTEDSSYCAYRHRRKNKLDSIITTNITVVRLATEEEKQKLFDAIKENGYKWNAKTKTLEKLIVPNKFDITTLKPFESKVLVRNSGCIWRPAIYGCTVSEKHYVVGGIYWTQCIPYEHNEHLLGNTNDCDPFFKIWE